MSETDISPEELPRAHVLGYITTVSTPTRVRMVAARVMVVLGTLNIVIALFIMGVVAYEVYEQGVSWLPPGVALMKKVQYWMDQVRYYSRRNFYWILAIPLAWGVAIIPFVTARAVRRGRRLASLTAFIYVAAATVGAGITGLLLVCSGFTWQFTRHPRWYDWWAVWWLLLIPVAAMPPVLLKDVCAFLLWIVRHPIAEKPAVPFLPGGDGLGRDELKGIEKL